MPAALSYLPSFLLIVKVVVVGLVILNLVNEAKDVGPLFTRQCQEALRNAETDDGERVQRLVGAIEGKRVTWKELTGEPTPAPKVEPPPVSRYPMDRF